MKRTHNVGSTSVPVHDKQHGGKVVDTHVMPSKGGLNTEPLLGYKTPSSAKKLPGTAKAQAKTVDAGPIQSRKTKV